MVIKKKNKKKLEEFFLKRKRKEVIRSDDLGKTFLVHNGKNFIKIKVNSLMVNYFFGCFVLTRKKADLDKKKNKKK